MICETLYNLGEDVFYIASEFAYRIVKCATCRSAGKVMIGGEEFVCPKCAGAAAHPQPAGNRWFVSGGGKIGQVRFELTDSEHVDQSNHPRVIQYMLDSTGVGSGTLHDEGTVFPSEEEAEAECSRRNAGKDFADETTRGKVLV